MILYEKKSFILFKNVIIIIWTRKKITIENAFTEIDTSKLDGSIIIDLKLISDRL